MWMENLFRRFMQPEDLKNNEKAKALKNRVAELTQKIEQQIIDYDTLLNGIDTMVWLTYKPDLQGKANEAFLKFFNVRQVDIENKPLIEIMPKKEAEKCIAINQEIFKTGKSNTSYEWVTRHDGKKRLLKINKRLKKNGSTYIVASAEDITDLETIRNQLEKEGRFTQSLVDTAQALIVVLDTNASILKCNPYFEEITGYKFSEIKGLNWFDVFIPESDLEQVKDKFEQCLHNHTECTKSIINPIKTKKGDELLVEWFSQTLMDNYNVTIGIISIGQNVTKQKLIEEELWTKIIELEIKLKNLNDCPPECYLDGKNKTILLIEDEQNVLHLLAIVLQKQHYTVIQANTSKKAKEIIDSNLPIDLIITDFYMSGENGFQLIEYAKKSIPDIKYLITSGILPTNFNIPKENFLKKPFSIDDLNKKIKLIMGD
jgi:PAS domain S-box-containing protein